MAATTPITHDNRTLTLSQWAGDLCIPYSVLKMRYKRGDRAPHIFRPISTRKPQTKRKSHKPQQVIAPELVTHNGTTQPLKHWATELGISYSVLKSRYIRGDRGKRLLRPVFDHIREVPEQTTPANVYLNYFGKTRSLFEWSRVFNIGFDTVVKRYEAGIREPLELFADVPKREGVMKLRTLTNTTTRT